jgi:integrase
MASISSYQTKSGKRYKAEVRKNHTSQSKSFSTKRGAELWAKHVEQHLKDNPPEPLEQSQTSHTRKELIEYYRQNHVSDNERTRKSQHSLLKFWEKRLGHYKLKDLNPEIINKYRRVLSNDVCKYKPGTILQYMIRLRAVLHVAVKELRWLEHSPMDNMKFHKDSDPRDRYLTVDEIQRPLRTCKQDKQHQQIYPVVFLAATPGMRLSEVTNIKLEDHKLQNQPILLPKTKNRRPHMIYLTDEVLQVIWEYINRMLKIRPYNWRDVILIENRLKYDGREYLFPSMAYKDKPVYLQNAWRKVRKLSKLNDGKVVFHTLRYTVVSLLEGQGKTLLDIKHVLNNKDMRSTARYAHLTQQHQRENFVAITQAITGT